MRVSREVHYGAAGGSRVAHDRMHRELSLYSLQVPIGPRMKVGPLNLWRVPVIGLRSGNRWIDVVRVEDMRRTDCAECTDGTPEVHVVASDQQSAASSTEAQDPGAILLVETLADVDCKQPQLVVRGSIEGRKNRIGPV